LCSLATSGTRGGAARAAAHQAPTMWACTRSAPASRGPIRHGRPLQAARGRDLADPVGVRGQAVAGSKLQPRRGSVTGQQPRRDAVPAQLRRQPQREQLRPARLQHAQNASNPHPGLPLSTR
jgi:hypothetical protein